MEVPEKDHIIIWYPVILIIMSKIALKAHHTLWKSIHYDSLKLVIIFFS